jgi:hypothetical protein
MEYSEELKKAVRNKKKHFIAILGILGIILATITIGYEYSQASYAQNHNHFQLQSKYGSSQ